MKRILTIAATAALAIGAVAGAAGPAAAAKKAPSTPPFEWPGYCWVYSGGGWIGYPC